MNDTLTLIVSAVLGGGIFTGIASLINGRSTARKTDTESAGLAAKLPAEVDSVIVQGAEAAVLTMSNALKAAQDRIDSLEEDRAKDRERIAELESKVRDLEGKFATAQQALSEAQADAVTLRRELTEFARDRDHR